MRSAKSWHARAGLAWVGIVGTFVLSTVLWLIRGYEMWPSYIVWAIAIIVAIYALIVAVSRRNLVLGLAGVVTIFSDVIVFFVLFNVPYFFDWLSGSGTG